MERRDVSVPGSIKGLAGLAFTFIGPDKILGINPSDPQKSHLVRFPSGEKIGDVPLGLGNSELRGATHGDFLFIGPLKGYPIGILELASKQIQIGIRQHAADMYDGVLVAERMNGQLALHSKGRDLPLATLQLAESSLGRLSSAAVSPDLNYLAVSTRSRGAVWDIANDHRIFHLRGFNGAAFDGQAMYADFPKFMQTGRAIGELRLDTGAGVPHRELGDEIAIQHGGYLVETKPRNKNNSAWSNVDFQVSNIATGQLLWSRYFHADVPAISFNTQAQTALFRWRFADPEAKQAIRSIPDFKVHGEKDDYFCEVVDANLGGLIAYFGVKTNNASLRFSGGSATRNWAVMEAVGDQILTYALPSGDEAGHFFGAKPVLSTSGLLAVQGEAREITVYDLASSEQKQQYRFTQPVAFKVFSPDSRRLLVFTNDQTMYLLDTTFNPPASEPVVTSERK